MLWIVVFVIALAVLIKASDYFTEAAEKLGLNFGLPPFIIGVTIVALGTSLPELMSSIIAVLKGNTEIVAANVIGSNIANILLVLGVAAIIAKKMKLSYELIHVDLPLLASSAIFLTVTIWDGVFTFPEAILSLVGIIIYLAYTVRNTGHEDKETKKEVNALEKNSTIKQTAIVIISAIFIFIGAKFTIDSVIQVSQMLNIATELIAVSAIALGTSLPELMVSISAARKGKAEIAIGNVLGSNIFNSFVVMGIPTLIKPLTITKETLNFSLPMMVIATILYFIMVQDKEITKYEGAMLVLFYIFFIGKLFNLF